MSNSEYKKKLIASEVQKIIDERSEFYGEASKRKIHIYDANKFLASKLSSPKLEEKSSVIEGDLILVGDDIEDPTHMLKEMDVTVNGNIYLVGSGIETPILKSSHGDIFVINLGGPRYSFEDNRFGGNHRVFVSTPNNIILSLNFQNNILVRSADQDSKEKEIDLYNLAVFKATIIGEANEVTFKNTVNHSDFEANSVDFEGSANLGRVVAAKTMKFHKDSLNSFSAYAYSHYSTEFFGSKNFGRAGGEASIMFSDQSINSGRVVNSDEVAFYAGSFNHDMGAISRSYNVSFTDSTTENRGSVDVVGHVQFQNGAKNKKYANTTDKMTFSNSSINEGEAQAPTLIFDTKSKNDFGAVARSSQDIRFLNDSINNGETGKITSQK